MEKVKVRINWNIEIKKQTDQENQFTEGWTDCFLVFTVGVNDIPSLTISTILLLPLRSRT